MRKGCEKNKRLKINCEHTYIYICIYVYMYMYMYLYMYIHTDINIDTHLCNIHIWYLSYIYKYYNRNRIMGY
jgi:hypothetical protein